MPVDDIYKNICDLGFTFTPSLCPRAHIDRVTCKGLKVLGFVKRISSDFKLSSSFKAIYYALIRPISEYGIPKQLKDHEEDPRNGGWMLWKKTLKDCEYRNGGK
ncbi:Uncharacterized protein FWK35_00017926 [Aphis craccivora]|uniref:Uncharacterized protein n=1 Tax=Aphis craccivora TaxID=307492 RepID=A0A6G0Y9P1_APHCR|nr:Uncharacterized protein FWK35_00017926 [Aphis craccivora]